MFETHSVRRFFLGTATWRLAIAAAGCVAACSSSSSDASSPAGSAGSSPVGAIGGGGSSSVSTNGGASSFAGTTAVGGGGASSSVGGASGGAVPSGGAPGDAGGSSSSGTSGTGGTSGGASSASGGGGTSSHAGSGGSGGGSAGSGGGSAGSGGSGGVTADCGITPVTPNATPATRKVLCYLHSIYGNHILSGQEEDNDDSALNIIVKATGKYPAIRAFDVNNSMAPTQCVAQWNAGGLCMFGYHMGINGQAFNVATNIGNVLTSGTSENNSFNSDLDRYAQWVQPLQAAGGVAIARLFHEAGKNCNWFWWSMGTATQWQDLYKYAFNYLTKTKGLNNLIWIAPLCGRPDPGYDPGASYIDLGGADTYQAAGDYQPLTNLFQQTESTFPNMMVALHECGPIPDPAQLKSSATKWLFFNVWSGTYATPAYNPTAHLQAVYSNDYVINRDRLPSFK